MLVSEEVNPRWIRLWHGGQAALFLGLVITGVNMHYVNEDWVFVPFALAIKLHNGCGVLSALLWAGFVWKNRSSGNVRHYLPNDLDLSSKLSALGRYYLVDMFRRQAPPPPSVEGSKFNAVQQLVYLVVMYVLLPVSTLTGMVLLFPLLAPQRALRWGGLWPVALGHLGAGYLLSMFLVFHIYLATTGERVSTLYREMLTGVRTSTVPPPPEEDSSRPQ